MQEKKYLTGCEIWEVVIQTEKPVSTREAAERMVKILDSKYLKEKLEQVSANATHRNSEERNQLLGLTKDFEDLFDGTIGDWDTDTVELNSNTNFKPFNYKYYLLPRINKDTFRKELYRLVETGMSTLVQQSQYDIPVFIIPKK